MIILRLLGSLLVTLVLIAVAMSPLFPERRRYKGMRRRGN
jgi:hypothetical protein